jgi:hypothetical protein
MNTSSDDSSTVSPVTNGSAAPAAVTSSEAAVTSSVAMTSAVAADAPRADYPWRRAKKVAAMLSFSGKDYFGMQRNPGMRTIEEELMAAFRQAISAFLKIRGYFTCLLTVCVK